MPSINRKQHFHLSGKQAGFAVTSVHPFWIFSIDEDFQFSAAQKPLTYRWPKKKGGKKHQKVSKAGSFSGKYIPVGFLNYLAHTSLFHVTRSHRIYGLEFCFQMFPQVSVAQAEGSVSDPLQTTSWKNVEKFLCDSFVWCQIDTDSHCLCVKYELVCKHSTATRLSVVKFAMQTRDGQHLPSTKIFFSDKTQLLLWSSQQELADESAFSVQTTGDCGSN